MIPWDFGLINAFKAQLNCPVFPSEKPDLNPPYLVLEFDRYQEQELFYTKVAFSIKISDDSQWSDERFKIAKEINRIVSTRVNLYQAGVQIGHAQIKIVSLENKRNNLILKLTARLYLKEIYEDAKDEL